MTPPLKRLILYDLDGTLVDTRTDIVQAVNYTLGEMGFSPLPREEVIRSVGLGLRQLLAACLKTEDPGRIEEGVKVYRPYYAKHLLDHSRLYPGALDLLEYFKERKQAVITNKPNPYSRRILELLGVDRFFFEVIGGDSDLPKKPAPETVLWLMGKSNLTAGETLLIGDSPIDAEAGRNAGVFTVIVRQGFSSEEEIRRSGPDKAVDSLKELLQLAKEKKW
ncbi:MAG: HAD-IA family hydrolase [Candidatus Omnitrophica bacterium]|nr:HAD-IA family hydrolase [Candidatus Omnitrophota bacterium]